MCNNYPSLHSHVGNKSMDVLQAFIMAFTSDSIPRFVYYFSKHDTYNETVTHTMVGYINSSLSVFRIEDFQTRSIPNTVPYWFNNATDLNCRYT